MRSWTYRGVGLTLLIVGACYPTFEESPIDNVPPANNDNNPSTNNNQDLNPDAVRATAIKPNVMLLIDRSGSMADPGECEEPTCPSKWQELLGLDIYLAEAKRSARLGMAVFPSEGVQCEVAGAVKIPLSEADDVDARIIQTAYGITPGGRTPLAAALDEIGRTARLDASDRSNILLVLTDGQPNCACAPGDLPCERTAAVNAVRALAERPIRIDVDIIGFGSSATQAQETLRAMAIAAGDDDYYQTDNLQRLLETLVGTSVARIPCAYYLDNYPFPPSLEVFLDGDPVAPCADDPCSAGYSYDSTDGRVDFEGATCETLRDGNDHEVEFALP